MTTLVMDALLCLALYLLYRPILHGPFTFDDLTILNNLAYMRRVDPMTQPLVPHGSVNFGWVGWGGLMLNVRLLPSLLSTRPLTNWTYEMNVQYGGLNPYIFHWTSLGIGMACAVTFQHILLHLVHPLPAFLGALVLSMHPLPSMSIAYIAGRSSLLAGLFILLSILAFLGGWWILAGMCVVVGMLAKEETIAAVPILMWMYFGGFAR